MSAVIDPWLDVVRREAQHVAFHGETKSTLICTSYNPDTHAIKGILVPHMVETGWVSLAAIHSGNGYGILVGPKAGDPQKLDGDQFDVHFENGDPNAPMAVHRRFSTPDKPPRVESGEVLIQQSSTQQDSQSSSSGGGSSNSGSSAGSSGSGSSSDKNNMLFFDKDKQIKLQHESGNTLFFDKDKQINVQHFAKKGTLVWDKDGHVTLKTNGGNITTDAGDGTHTFKAKSHVLQATNISLAGTVQVDGDINQTGSHNLTGNVAAAAVTSGGQPVQTT